MQNRTLVAHYTIEATTIMQRVKEPIYRPYVPIDTATLTPLYKGIEQRVIAIYRFSCNHPLATLSRPKSGFERSQLGAPLIDLDRQGVVMTGALSHHPINDDFFQVLLLAVGDHCFFLVCWNLERSDRKPNRGFVVKACATKRPSRQDIHALWVRPLGAP